MDECRRLCALECLNNDTLIAVLAACHSFSDLDSLIQSSPIILRAFLSAKAAILLRVVSNILGPATRDAALLAQASQFDVDYRECDIDAVVQDYRARLRITTAPWVTTLDAKTAVVLTRVTRLAQFFVHLFCYSRFRFFAQELNSTQSIPPSLVSHLTPTEHCRIAKAILRRQLIVLFHGGKYGEPQDHPRFVKAVFSLFQPWESEQISDLDHFLGTLLGSMKSYQMSRRGPNGERESVYPEYWSRNYYPDLAAIAEKFKSLLTSDSSLFEHLCQVGEVLRGRIYPYHGLFKIFVGSHYLTTTPTPSSAAAGFDQEMELSSQPWAWKDALGERETCRWGCDLVRKPPPDSPNQQEYEEVKEALASWRWFGMIFWDQERAEQLKQLNALKLCKSGWLIPWQD
ncbi:hypothetical protein AAL_06227 [Moelleriella libera RCEF 2490]|uniref:Uncharacterized protein n=1 Tax=Moelleriella libera RCEF 2490 TaxID=1081109 RepID=A0A167ZFQ6_9HYPO|nr:hypothetical protein AAL_06227 [Moelleriella libera RCEF 2490]